MNSEELKKIKQTMFCPECESEEIDVFFTNSDGEEVSFTYVNPDYSNSDYGHMGYCRDCDYEEAREMFDEKLRKESLKRIDDYLRKQRSRMTLTELDNLGKL